MTTETRTKRRKMTKEEQEAKRVERLLPLAKATFLEIWNNPESHSTQDSLARHFGVTKTRMRDAITVMLDHVVPLGFWVESRPYRVVTKTPMETYKIKNGYLVGVLRSLERTAKSLKLTENRAEIINLAKTLSGAVMMMEGVQDQIARELNRFITEDYQQKQIELLRAEVERAQEEVHSLS